MSSTGAGKDRQALIARIAGILAPRRTSQKLDVKFSRSSHELDNRHNEGPFAAATDGARIAQPEFGAIRVLPVPRHPDQRDAQH